MDKNETFITTIDNPYDYFTQFDDWYAFDVQKGYNTLNFLARLTKTSEAFSDLDYDLEIDRAIDEMLKYNVSGLYKRIYNNSTQNSNETKEKEEN